MDCTPRVHKSYFSYKHVESIQDTLIYGLHTGPPKDPQLVVVVDAIVVASTCRRCRTHRLESVTHTLDCQGGRWILQS